MAATETEDALPNPAVPEGPVDFGYLTPDIHGITITDHSLWGLTLKHTGNGKLYKITGIAYMGESDEWGFICQQTAGIPICRPLSHLLGNRGNGEPRYEMSENARVIIATVMNRGR